MKLLLFKSKTCGPCKMFEPQVIKAATQLGVEYVPVDVEQSQNFKLWTDISTSELLKKFTIVSSGVLVFLLDQTKEDGPMIMFNRPTRADEIVKSCKQLIDAGKN